MKNFEKLIKECESDLASIGISIGNVVSYSINTRAKSRWGQCKEVGENRYEINISQRLLMDDVSDQAAKDTILHEMLHTVEGGMGHKGKWKELAQKVNRELPQYTITRVTSNAEKGIESTEGPKKIIQTSNHIKETNRGGCAQTLMYNLPFFVSIACFFGYIAILAFCLYDIFVGEIGLSSDDKVVLLLSKRYLPRLLLTATIGLISSVISLKKCENEGFIKISKVLCLLFLLFAVLAIEIVLD